MFSANIEYEADKNGCFHLFEQLFLSVVSEQQRKPITKTTTCCGRSHTSTGNRTSQQRSAQSSMAMVTDSRARALGHDVPHGLQQCSWCLF